MHRKPNAFWIGTAALPWVVCSHRPGFAPGTGAALTLQPRPSEALGVPKHANVGTQPGIEDGLEVQYKLGSPQPTVPGSIWANSSASTFQPPRPSVESLSSQKSTRTPDWPAAKEDTSIDIGTQCVSITSSDCQFCQTTCPLTRTLAWSPGAWTVSQRRKLSVTLPAKVRSIGGERSQTSLSSA